MKNENDKVRAFAMEVINKLDENLYLKRFSSEVYVFMMAHNVLLLPDVAKSTKLCSD